MEEFIVESEPGVYTFSETYTDITLKNANIPGRFDIPATATGTVDLSGSNITGVGGSSPDTLYLTNCLGLTGSFAIPAGVNVISLAYTNITGLTGTAPIDLLNGCKNIPAAFSLPASTEFVNLCETKITSLVDNGVITTIFVCNCPNLSGEFIVPATCTTIYMSCTKISSLSVTPETVVCDCCYNYIA